MPASRVSNERGVALAVAIFALVVIGALVAGTFFAGRLEQQSGQNTVYAAQAAGAAEAELTNAIANRVTAASLGAMLDNEQVTLGTQSFGNGVSATSQVTRMTSSLFLVEAMGARTAGTGALAVRRLGTLIRLAQMDIAVNAGLTALGQVSVSGNSTVSGHDATPSEWSSAGVDCPDTASVTGLKYNGTLEQQGNSTISGEPETELDPSLDSSNIFGGSEFDSLKELATLILNGNVNGLAPAVTGDPPKCDAAIQNNWGAPTDPASPCFDYFPVVYHQGDLTVQGNGAGQGILLVEGNLNVQGTIDFYGPVIVTGSVNVRGTGNDDVKFYGGILAKDVNLDDSQLNGNATVTYSSCAIKRALQGSAVPTALNERSWAQLYTMP
jgi:hypothetical protein